MSSKSLSFVPSRVDGLDGVVSITILPDRIIFNFENSATTHFFHDFARSTSSILKRVVSFFRFSQSWKMIGDRDWFHPPAERFFRLYTSPPITVYMPEDDIREYGPSVFCRVQQVWRLGYFDTFDLG